MLIYGGTEYAYAKDPDFNHISKRPNFWREVIDRFYDKYKGIRDWHTEIVQNVTRTGKLVTPTGRTFRFYPYEGKWPRTQILNYPVN